MKTLEYMLKKGELEMSAENALKQLGKVKYVVVTNPGGTSQHRNCPFHQWNKGKLWMCWGSSI